MTRAQEAFERRVMAAKARADSWGCLAPEEETAFAEEALQRGLDDSIVWMVERLPVA